MMGCYGCMFAGRRRPSHRRSSSTSSLPRHDQPPQTLVKLPSSGYRHRRAPSAVAAARSLPQLPPPPDVKHNKKALPMAAGAPPLRSISTELDNMLYDPQKSKVTGAALVRATSGNVMLFGNLGNIRTNKPSANFSPKTNDAGNTTKNVIKEVAEKVASAPPAPELCRALSKRIEPEELKRLGNEEYKKGNAAEAIGLYDRAILMEPVNAACRSNRAAALMQMGRLLEAVDDCKEAVRIDPLYFRAQHRLATLYLRLGEPDKAIKHYKLSQNEAKNDEISQAGALQVQFTKCTEARKVNDWHAMLKAAQNITSSGADSAPQAYAYLAEALLKLRKYEDAILVWKYAPKFDVDASTKLFGAEVNAYFLAIHAQVQLAAGRFEDALDIAHKAAKIEPSNHEISMVARRIRAVSLARSKGNELFSGLRYGEACIAYTEGLDHDPNNPVLLCNRAACRAKLCHFDKAIEDCNNALSVRPSYSKARLRRADCNAKLQRWEAAIEDYEVLVKEVPGDEEVKKSLSDAQGQLKKKHGARITQDARVIRNA